MSLIAVSTEQGSGGGSGRDRCLFWFEYTVLAHTPYSGDGYTAPREMVIPVSTEQGSGGGGNRVHPGTHSMTA